MKNLVTPLVIILGVIFLVVPVCADSFSHFLQNKTYNSSHEIVLECRAQTALELIHKEGYRYHGSMEKVLNNACGELPKYDDFVYEGNGILSLYNWLGQKVTFVPL